MLANIQVRLDGLAFADPGELPRILRKLADEIEALGGPRVSDRRSLIDADGNRAGFYVVIDV